MGALAEVMIAGPRVRKGPSCSVGLWLRTLDPETRDEATTMLQDPMWPSTQLAKRFKALDLDAAGSTIARHRRGDCKNCG